VARIRLTAVAIFIRDHPHVIAFATALKRDADAVASLFVVRLGGWSDGRIGRPYVSRY